MKTSFAPLMALLANTVIAASIPGPEGWHLRRADDINEQELTIVDLEVTNDAFPGRVFTGTAQSIYEEIIAEKPELLADVEPLEAGSLLLEKRATVDCGWYGNLPDHANIYGCMNAVAYMRSLGTSACIVNSGTSTCAQVGCKNSCGLHLCNRTDGRVSVHCKDISNDYYAIAKQCATRFNSVSGRIVFDNHFTGVRLSRC